MSVLAPLHPYIVHTPIALLVTAVLFELVGRATDLAWWRKAAFAMLIVGAAGAWLAVWSGNAAEEPAEDQGVPHEVIEQHEDAATWAAWLATGAVVTRAVAGRMGAARGLIAALGLLLHLMAAGAVLVTGLHGGKLVYEHGAGVKVDGQPVRSANAPPEGEHH